MNWLEFTQLVKKEKGKLQILPEKIEEITNILAIKPPFIDRPEQTEYFQRKYGVDPKHKKDNRNLANSQTITASMIAEQKIKTAFISESLRSPIAKITANIIDKIAESTGLNTHLIEETLLRIYPRGAIGAFMTEYFEMAFRGRDNATKFERATTALFNNVFGFNSIHTGSIGLTPDVLILSDNAGYQAIIDNKAYSQYSITNDHHNRMVQNYLKNIANYSDYDLPVAFFTYISGGFGSNINQQINKISEASAINGSAITVSSMIALVSKYNENNYTHGNLKTLFSINRQVLLSDI